MLNIVVSGIRHCVVDVVNSGIRKGDSGKIGEDEVFKGVSVDYDLISGLLCHIGVCIECGETFKLFSGSIKMLRIQNHGWF